MANTKSLDLESSSSQYAYISDGDQTGLDLNSDFTMEFWAKLESLSSGDHYVIMKYIASSKAYYAGFTDSGKMKLVFFNDAGVHTTFLSDNDITSIGNWKHYAITVDISVPSAVLYVDGVSVDITINTTNATSIKNSSADFVIGAFKESSTSYVDGLIDEVRVWNDIRTATEISDNYKKELVGTETGLVGYWKFNDSALDETSNDNDLTLSGSPSYSSDIPVWSITLVVDTMALALNYGNITLTKISKIVVDTMNLTVNFADVFFGNIITLVVDTMNLSLNFADATLTKISKLIVNTMNLAVDFKDVILKKIGWTNETKPTSSWTEDTKPTSSWTNEDK